MLAAVADAGADSDNIDIKGITRAVLDVCCVERQGVSNNADQLVCKVQLTPQAPLDVAFAMHKQQRCCRCLDVGQELSKSGYTSVTGSICMLLAISTHTHTQLAQQKKIRAADRPCRPLKILGTSVAAEFDSRIFVSLPHTQAFTLEAATCRLPHFRHFPQSWQSLLETSARLSWLSFYHLWVCSRRRNVATRMCSLTSF